MVLPLDSMFLRAHEDVIARSAAPDHVSREASVYVLRPAGFKKAHEGQNGFTGLVERPRAGNLWPICSDPEGATRYVPVRLLRARLRASGIPEVAGAHGRW